MMSLRKCVAIIFQVCLLWGAILSSTVTAQPQLSTVDHTAIDGLRKPYIPFQYSGDAGLYSRRNIYPLRDVHSMSASSTSYTARTTNSVNIPSARQRGVKSAWKLEKNLVQSTGKGTRPWTPAEKKELFQTGQIKGYVGHHINNVSSHPELAHDPKNIKFVKGSWEHLQEHGGNFRNPTKGPLIDRKKMGENYKWVGVGQVAIGSVLLYYHLPVFVETYGHFRDGGFRDERMGLAFLDSSLKVGFDATLVVGGASRILAFSLAQSSSPLMHSGIGALHMTSRVLGPLANVILAVEVGLNTYRFYQGYISLPEFVVPLSTLAGGIAGGAAGTKAGAVVGGGIGSFVGGVLGAAGGAYTAKKVASSFFEQPGRSVEDLSNEYMYAKYDEDFVWSNSKLQSLLYQ